MNKRILLLISFIFLSLQEVSAATHKIYIDAMTYRPEELTVKVGDKIIWINTDINVHTATARDAAFSSGSIRKKKKWTYVADKEGEHPYFCVFHPGMKGKLTVIKE
jgi:plastocyanin